MKIDDIAPDINYMFKVVPVTVGDVILQPLETRWVRALPGKSLFYNVNLIVFSKSIETKML